MVEPCFFRLGIPSKSAVRPEKNICLVVLHNFSEVGAGGQMRGVEFFFFQIKHKATQIYSLHLPKKVHVSLLYQKISLYKFQTSIRM